MKLNKKYFLAVFTSYALFGVSSAYAMQCEKEIEEQWETAYVDPKTNKRLMQSFDYTGNTYYATLEDAKSDWHREVSNFIKYDGWVNAGQVKSCREYASYQVRLAVVRNRDFPAPGFDCTARYFEATNCKNPEVFIYKKGSSQQSSSSSSIPSNSVDAYGQSNSPEALNLQVTKTNKQNYQAIQQAYNQAMQGKGRKNNKEANAVECMKNNPAAKTFKNSCNQSVNFSYCFSGTFNGSKLENPQTLEELRCQNNQFATITIGPGDNIPGNYWGLELDGLACKHPSQPVDMVFDKSTNSATGRCSF